MSGEQRPGRDLKNFVLPESGQLLETGDPWEPYQVLDSFGRPIEPVATYLRDLMAADSSPLTPRSYGMDLLRWWRYLWAFGIEWDRAVREDARDFMLWMKLADSRYASTGVTAARTLPRYLRPGVTVRRRDPRTR
ncbi:site-specific integrase [Streptomyces sp. NPDC057806]|uniref:site-specific integrase n=1 Tax=Streptomyces sp. NPDC057806 TaxID=3346255 RepID=UPI0036804A81